MPGLLMGAMFWTFCLAAFASGQQRPRASASAVRSIEAGTTVSVRTNETINVNDSDGQIFSGVVDRDVQNRNGAVAIPRGSEVELVVREIGDNEFALDLEAVTVNNRRYGVTTDETTLSAERRDGIGVNQRTGKYVGGGAVLGAVIGAIAGGRKGAAIGAGAGAAAGAGTQILTRGKSVSVPAESLLTFRLEQPLQPSADTGFTRNGTHYHQGYAYADESSAAYRAGVQAGRVDAERNLPATARSDRYNAGQQRADYQAGYNRGYEDRSANNNNNNRNNNNNNARLGRTDPGVALTIGRDNSIRWQAPATARVYVQVDNMPLKLFAEGASGTQAAPWIESGHLYLFIMQDLNGREIAREQLDLRQRRR
jgi:outer membrane lipoprotein SlyB